MLPAPGFVGRMRVYFAEMFPLPRRMATAVLLWAGVASVLARVHGVPAALISPHGLVGCWAVFGALLLLRLMDELKDEQTDRALFPGRPLPSGRVRRADVAFALALVAGLYVPLHATAGAATASAALVLAYAGLMFRWFFVPRLMRPRLPLTLATHTLVIPLLLLHLVVLFADQHALPLGMLRWRACLLLVGMLWALSFAWEIARKIRSPEQEDAYVTYSSLLGAAGAVGLAAAAQTAAAAAGLALLRDCDAPALAFGLLAAGWAIAMGAHARFLRRPSPGTARLAVFAEADLAATLLAAVLTLVAP